MPTASVRAAEPSKVLVTTTPISLSLRPKPARWVASSTLMAPSVKARRLRVTNRRASPEGGWRSGAVVVWGMARPCSVRRNHHADGTLWPAPAFGWAKRLVCALAQSALERDAIDEVGEIDQGI